MSRRGRHSGPDEQYVNRNGLLVTIFRSLTARDANTIAKQHGSNAQVSGRGDRRTVTLSEDTQGGRRRR